MGIYEKIEILKDFFNKYGIKININELISNGTINIDTLENSNDIFNGFYVPNGVDNHREIQIFNTDSILDLPVWIHEICHYLNYSNSDNNTRYLFTESISYAFELLFLDYLSNLDYDYDVAVYQGERFSYFYDVLYNAYFILKAYIVYDKTNKLNIDNYKMVFGTDIDYDTCLKIFYETISEDFKIIFNLIQYSIAAVLGPYMYIEWEKDSKFINNILEFNNSISFKNINDSLTTINLTGLDTKSVEIVQNDVDLYIGEIAEGTDFVVAKYNTLNAYFEDFVKLYKDSKDLIFKRIDDIVFIKKILNNILKPYFENTCPFPEQFRFTKMNKEEKLILIENYYKYMGYDIDLGELINHVNFHQIEIENIEEEPFSIPQIIFNGDNDDECGYNEINVNDTGFLIEFSP